MMDATADGKDEESVIAKVTRDPTYFFHLIVLKVENTLFRIPLSYLSKHSEHFKGFTWKSLATTELNPFVVDEITVQEFRHFLRITLPFATAACDLETLWMGNSGPFPVLRDEWISVLKVSTVWHCLLLRKLAIRKIGFDNPTEQIVLGRRYYVSSWVEAGYKTMVTNRTISDEQMEKIGLLESFKLLRISQKYYQGFHYPSSTDNEVKETFQEELQSIAAAEEVFLNLKGNKRKAVKKI